MVSLVQKYTHILLLVIMVFYGVTCVAHGCEHLIREVFVEGNFLWGTVSGDIIGVEILIYVIFRSS